MGYSKGAPIKISDIGKAIPGVENNQIGAWVFPGKANDDPAFKAGQSILLVIFKQPGANVIQTVNAIRGAAAARAEYPARDQRPHPARRHPDDPGGGARTSRKR